MTTRPTKSEITAALSRDFKLLIGGRQHPAVDGRVMATINPATGETLASVPNAGKDDINEAVRAAKSAQPGWRATPFPERRKLVLRLAEVLRANARLFGILD